jgi:hypothetical protein
LASVSSQHASVAPSSLILIILMVEVIHSCETSVLTKATGHHIPDDGIPHKLMRLIMEDSCHVHNSPFADGQAVFT